MIKIVHLIVLTVSLTACNNADVSSTSCTSEGEIIGRDFTKWLCGGGYFIALASDTIRVFTIPDDDIRQEAQGKGTEPFSIPVMISYQPASGGCEEYVHELTCISRREN